VASGQCEIHGGDLKSPRVCGEVLRRCYVYVIQHVRHHLISALGLRCLSSIFSVPHNGCGIVLVRRVIRAVGGSSGNIACRTRSGIVMDRSKLNGRALGRHASSLDPSAFFLEIPQRLRIALGRFPGPWWSPVTQEAEGRCEPDFLAASDA
jgi:hypothetical protein